MIIQCPSCRTRYHYDESRFGTAPIKKIRCTKCPTVFEIRNPSGSAPGQGFQPEETGPLNSPVLKSDDFSLDATAMGGGPRKRPPSSIAVPPAFVLRPAVPVAASSPSAPSTPSARPGASSAQVAPPSGSHRTGSYTAPGTMSGNEGKRLVLPEWERLSLACIAGPDAGKIFEIDKPRVVIGRANADILLSDGECSRQHAAIEVQGEKAILVDLGSTNGTYVGERQVKEYELENRSEFDVGASTLMFIRSRRD